MLCALQLSRLTYFDANLFMLILLTVCFFPLSFNSFALFVNMNLCQSAVINKTSLLCLFLTFLPDILNKAFSIILKEYWNEITCERILLYECRIVSKHFFLSLRLFHLRFNEFWTILIVYFFTMFSTIIDLCCCCCG